MGYNINDFPPSSGRIISESGGGIKNLYDMFNAIKTAIKTNTKTATTTASIASADSSSLAGRCFMQIYNSGSVNLRYGDSTVTSSTGKVRGRNGRNGTKSCQIGSYC